jgi:hypothetical protein
MKTIKFALQAALAGSAVSGHAADFKFANDGEASVKVVATAGTIIRTDDPQPSTYAYIPSVAVPGAAPGGLVGQTGGSDLNFRKNHAVSTVLKAMLDVDVHNRDVGAFARVDAWEDLVLGHRGTPYGNYPNGFTTGAPLSDRGLAPDAKFSNVRLRDVYAYARFQGAGSGADAKRLEVRVGRQVLNWGVSQFFTGGLGAVTNPYDTAAQLRPGALPQEGRVPVGMLSLNASLGKDWGIEAYAPYEFRPANVPACGTFFDAASVTPDGCDIVGPFGAPLPGTPLATAESLTERALLGNGYYLRRRDETAPSGAHQFGLSLRYTSTAWNTEFRGYVARSDNTLRNIYSLTIENVNGGFFPAGVAGALQRLVDPNGMRYGLVYPKGTQVFGASFDTRLDPSARVFGEVAWRRNQPIGLSPVDLLLAGLLRSPTSLLQLRKNILAVPAGATYEGYDRHPVMTASLGANKVFAKALGAERVVLAGELGYSHVSGLPDPAVLRYGRGLAYGGAPYYLNGALTACAVTMPGLNGVPGKTCTYDGYITRNAWGLRGRLAATYGGLLFGADLTPSLTLAKDVKGYSHDATFSEGRMTSRLGLRADWGKRFFAEAAYSHIGGGNYNLLADRSNLSLVVGTAF